MSFSSEKDRLYAELSPAERAYADFLLRVIPNFRYELSGRPRLNPVPAPGLESAVAAAKMVSVVLQAGQPASSPRQRRNADGCNRTPLGWCNVVASVKSAPRAGCEWAVREERATPLPKPPGAQRR